MLIAVAVLTVCCRSSKTENSIAAENMQKSPFWGELFAAVCNKGDNENVCISPLSAQIALGMTAIGAEGETKEEIHKTAQIGPEFGTSIAGMIRKSEEYEVSIANSIWINEILDVKNSFIKTNKESFDAEVNRIPFDLSAVGKINNWCNEKTNEKIKSIIDDIDPNCRMFLINALYFKAPWDKPFPKMATEKREFTTEGGEVIKCDMMKHCFNTRYYIDETVQMTVKPFKGKYDMLFILPRQGKSINEAIDYLTIGYDSCINRMELCEVELSLPRFKCEFGTSLKGYLQGMGIKRAFTDNAEFGGISKAPLYIDEVLQKSYISVDEEGAEAAAVTAVRVGLLSARPAKRAVLELNRPFIYAIRENTSGKILFIGKTGNPNKIK